MNGLTPSIRHQKRSFSARLARALFARSWWVITFILLNFSVFHPISKHLDFGKKKLLSSLSQLEKEKELALKKRTHLQLQIESQNDPSWVEMVLKKELGLVSEGQTKVHFITQ